MLDEIKVRKFLVILFFTIGLVQCIYVSLDYFNYETLTTAEVKPITGLIDIPSVTFCVPKQEINKWLFIKKISNKNVEKWVLKYMEERIIASTWVSFEKSDQKSYFFRQPPIISFTKSDVCLTFMSLIYGDLVNLTNENDYKTEAQHEPIFEMKWRPFTPKVGIIVHPPASTPHLFYDSRLMIKKDYVTITVVAITENLLPSPFTTHCLNYQEIRNYKMMKEFDEVLIMDQELKIDEKLKFDKELLNKESLKQTFARKQPKSYETCILLCRLELCNCSRPQEFYTSTLQFRKERPDQNCKCQVKNWNQLQRMCRQRCPRNCRTEHYISMAHFQPVQLRSAVFIRRNRDEIHYNSYQAITLTALFIEIGSLMSLWFDISFVSIALFFSKKLLKSFEKVSLIYGELEYRYSLRLTAIVFNVLCFLAFFNELFKFVEMYFRFQSVSLISLLPSKMGHLPVIEVCNKEYQLINRHRVRKEHRFDCEWQDCAWCEWRCMENKYLHNSSITTQDLFEISFQLGEFIEGLFLNGKKLNFNETKFTTSMTFYNPHDYAPNKCWSFDLNELMLYEELFHSFTLQITYRNYVIPDTGVYAYLLVRSVDDKTIEDLEQAETMYPNKHFSLKFKSTRVNSLGNYVFKYSYIF